MGQPNTFITRFEQSGGKETATYQETIDFYQRLAAKYNTVCMQQDAGSTDADYPLSVVYYSNDGRHDVEQWKKEGKLVILINNGIHPGEPDGIDASMMLLRDAAMGKIKIPGNIVLAVIPVYNIGGCLNRSPYSRVNQNGPEAYGFRGSAQNLDLNRDFIKMDSKEAASFARLFHLLDPDIFIDNHVSDGADYQHIMTLLCTQHDKLGGAVGNYMHQTMEPAIYADMKTRGYDLVPYVNDFDKTPDHGWTEFYDPPRFSSGYAALFQTFAFVPETHMLKPYKQRVQATYDLMRSFIKIAAQNAADIQHARAADRAAIGKQKEFALDWAADTTKADKITFKGYESGYKPSEVSGLPRLYYDRSKPFTRQVDFYDHFVPTEKVMAPKAYIIPHGWQNVISKLQCNGVQMQQIDKDTTIALAVYRIDKYESVQHPYEKHYLHKNVQVHKDTEEVKLLKGDYIIPVDQPAKRYIIEVLEPTAPDAFFAWNFFDAILQEKEYYSDYVFEDIAAKILREDAHLKKMLEEKRQSDAAFAKDGAAQLYFVYSHSKYFEPEFMRYPVFRME